MRNSAYQIDNHYTNSLLRLILGVKLHYLLVYLFHDSEINVNFLSHRLWRCSHAGLRCREARIAATTGLGLHRDYASGYTTRLYINVRQNHSSI